jgi:hypothetical protein
MSKLSSTIREQGARRTRIEDIAALGESLPEEHLRLVVGGLKSAGWCVHGTAFNNACYADIEQDCTL